MAMAGRWLTELQGVTVDFWGAPPPQLRTPHRILAPGLTGHSTQAARRPSSPDVPRATVPQGAVCSV